MHAQEHRPRLTADKAKGINARSDSQDGAKHIRKIKNVGERMKSLDSRYDEKFKAPEDRLLKFWAGDPLSKVHQAKRATGSKAGTKMPNCWTRVKRCFRRSWGDVEESRQRVNQEAAAAAAANASHASSSIRWSA
jgi:hypothetical protein